MGAAPFGGRNEGVTPHDPPAGKAEVAIEGEVAIVTYENAESGFRVLKLAVDGRRDRLSVVGVFPKVGAGSRVRVRGTLAPTRDLDRTGPETPTPLHGDK